MLNEIKKNSMKNLKLICVFTKLNNQIFMSKSGIFSVDEYFLELHFCNL